MSIQHLHYAINEIDLAGKLLSIKNSTFFKRSIARLIAIRIDDFIKLGFLTNRQNENKQIIKDELNALQNLYVEHFKFQRDKYGAHFQHLDFGERLSNWSDINADKAIFFTEIPMSIYEHFSKINGYLPCSPTTLKSTTVSLIEGINNEFDLEQTPNLSSDILALTRPNSGGILNFTMIHTKAGTLKSLELLIDYELAMIENLKSDGNVLSPFIKLFITDLLSYVDNFFTRTDIINTSPQYEEGFDYYVASNIDSSNEKSNEIITQFKSNFKLKDHTSELRNIRNKACGHIDTAFTIIQLENFIVNFDLIKFNDFYQRLKSIFRSVCHSTIYLRSYLFDPFERLHGVQKMVGMEVSSFDGQPFPELPSSYISPNDENHYEQQYKEWIINEKDSIRSYFWDCFIHSEIIQSVQIDIPGSCGGTIYRHYNFRKVHKFFEKKLMSSDISTNDKVAIINLFQQCATSDPQTLAYLLDKTYPNNLDLQVYYIQALGQLSQQRSGRTIERCTHIYNTTNLEGKCLALRALFCIDINARRSNSGKHNAEVTNYSTHINFLLSSEITPFEKISLTLVLLSEFVFGNHHLSDSLDELYKEFLITCFIQSTDSLLASLLKLNINKSRLIEIQDLVKTNRFSTLVGVLSDFMEQKGFLIQSTLLRKLVTQGYILYLKEDNQELHNLSVIYFKIGDYKNAIHIAQFLTQKNAHQASYNYLLLDLYRQNTKYKTQFETLKSKVLTTFNLCDEERGNFEDILMPD